MNTHELCATITPFNINRKGFSDLTGALPHKSRRGNLYVMVLYEYDSNAIPDEPIENRQATIIHNDFLKIHNMLKSRGREPKV